MMNDAGDTLLEIKNLNVHYGDLQAVYDVTMSLNKGSMVSIIGANGAGKSTLLNSIIGLNKPTSGKILWKGEDITGLPTNRIISRGISMAPEGSRIFEDMTVMENLLMGAYPKHARRKRADNLERVFATFPVLKEKEGQLATFLSGGQRQMLAISRAIMASPELIICDEISLGLAPVIIKDIYAALNRINAEGVPFLLVEQEIKRCLKNTEYAYVMVKGKVVVEGPCRDLPEKEVSDAYFGINRFA
jgi:branched-chain amino acid transport system ATP-binding protein